MTKGYKAFNYDWTCQGKQYTCPGIFEDCSANELQICKRGIHFCEKLGDCFDYYEFSHNTKIAEVEAMGEIQREGNKSCTNKMHIIREIPWGGVMELINVGKKNRGFDNTGDLNFGNLNTGNMNSGNQNAGDYNNGGGNSGDYNVGFYNTGEFNMGSHNSGDWNTVDSSDGCFNTSPYGRKIIMFNKQSGWTLKEWHYSDARHLLLYAPKPTVWCSWGEMSDYEKLSYPEAEMFGGYLKTRGLYELEKERYAWWCDLPEGDKQAILSLPNFDADIFYECTLIDIRNDEKIETSF